VTSNELGASLRRWRDRLPPDAVGLPARRPRRSPGIRREELAMLAGLSVDYVTRLEQGRATSPSAQVLAALARALQLTIDERDYLFRVGGQVVPGTGRMSSHVTPGIQRLLRRLDEFPVSAHDAAWTLVAWNPLWATLMGDPSDLHGHERNLLWRCFTAVPPDRDPASDGASRHPTSPAGRVVRTRAEQDAFETAAVSDLRAAASRWPDDPGLRSLVSDLRRASARFAKLWDSRTVGDHAADRKIILHPEVGQIEVDCDVFTAAGSDLKVIAYTVEPGSAAAEKLALLRVVGLQSLGR
jgi:transcriptional regulator with XRE-family HTH domain